VIGVRKTAEDASIVDGGDEGPLRFLLIFLFAFLHPLLLRGIDLRTVSVRKAGHFRLRMVVWLSFTSPVCSLLSAWASSPSGGAVVAVPAGLRALFSFAVCQGGTLVARCRRCARAWKMVGRAQLASRALGVGRKRRRGGTSSPKRPRSATLRVSSCESEPRAELIVRRHRRRIALQLAFCFLREFRVVEHEAEAGVAHALIVRVRHADLLPCTSRCVAVVPSCEELPRQTRLGHPCDVS